MIRAVVDVFAAVRVEYAAHIDHAVSGDIAHALPFSLGRAATVYRDIENIHRSRQERKSRGDAAAVQRAAESVYCVGVHLYVVGVHGVKALREGIAGREHYGVVLKLQHGYLRRCFYADEGVAHRELIRHVRRKIGGELSRFQRFRREFGELREHAVFLFGGGAVGDYPKRGGKSGDDDEDGEGHGQIARAVLSFKLHIEIFFGDEIGFIVL